MEGIAYNTLIRAIDVHMRKTNDEILELIALLTNDEKSKLRLYCQNKNVNNGLISQNFFVANIQEMTLFILANL
jgi:hypothetical protein